MIKNLKNEIYKLTLIAFAVIFALTCAFSTYAQLGLRNGAPPTDFRHGAYDPGFAPVFSLPNNNAYVNVAVPLPDGKILIGGSFKVVAGKVRTHLARLNSDGSLDPSFDVSITTTSSIYNPSVYSLTPLPDGKILIGGSFTHVNGSARNNFARLNADGSLDTTFAVGAGFDNAVKAVAIQPDGQLLVAGNFDSFNGTARSCLARLNEDGSLDATLVNPNISSSFADKMKAVLPLPDGKIFIHGNFNTVNGVLRRGLARLNADGTLDASFVEPGTYGSFNFMYAFALRPDSKIYIGGSFEVRVNNQTVCRGFCRLNQDGTADTSYTTSATFVDRMYLQRDGRLMINGAFTSAGGSNRTGVTRLNENGIVDSSFNPDFYVDHGAGSLGTGNISDFVPLPDGGFLMPGSFRRINGLTVENLAKFDQSGNADPNFTTPFSGVGRTNTATLQPDGKLLVSGNFTRANGLLRGKIARLNPDGSTDASFNTVISNEFPGTLGFDDVNEITVQPDGKILIGGSFAVVNGESHKYLARLNPDGSTDTAFNPVMTYQGNGGGAVNVIKLQPDGKILIGGAFQTVDGAPRLNLARLNADGTLDADFVPPVDPGYAPSIRATIVQPDGKIVIGGDFRLAGSASVISVMRLHANGSPDQSFQLPASLNLTPYLVRSLVRTSDGKILAGGSRSFDARPLLVRFNGDGSIDESFTAGTIGNGFTNDSVHSIILQPYGKILIAGFFSGIGGIARPNIARLLENGKLDHSFRAPQTFSGINSMSQNVSGDLIVTGSFSLIENRLVTGIARLRSGFVTPSPFDFDGDGKTDIGITRPNGSAGREWWSQKSFDLQTIALQFGVNTDQPVPSDLTGDGKTDIAFWRPQTGEWFVLRSEDFTFYAFPFGAAGDIPFTGDFDGDGKSDPGVFRPSTATWYIQQSSGGTIISAFGNASDKPVVADYDGDGKSDLAIYRNNNGSSEWWIQRSLDNQVAALQFGAATDKAVPGDYTGDGRADAAIWRPQTGEWFVMRSEDGSFYAFPFGAAGDAPVPGDYDGDGKFDAAVFRPATANWYVQRSTAGILITAFGSNGDTPIPSVFQP